MRTNEAGIDLIKRNEGCKLTAYHDVVGVLTIGYGHTGEDVTPGLVITLERASNLLYSDIIEFEKQISRMLKVIVNDNQFSALVSFAYNVGAGNLYHSTLLKKLNAEDFIGAAGEFQKWTKAGGKEFLDLVRRRSEERDLFLKEIA